MCSGFFCSATWASYTFRSRSTSSGGRSSTRTASGLAAAMWRATSRTNCLKSSVRATKSVSQFTSTSTPTRPLKWMYASTSPSDASRPARVSALAAPFLRSTSTAFSRSPPASSSARLQSIIPAPVRARSSATCFAPTSFTLATVAHSSIRTPPSRRGARRAAAGCDRSRPGVGLGLAPAARFRWCGRRCLLGLQARRDGLGFRPPLATRRLLLALALRLRLDAGLRRVGHRLAFLDRLTQRHLPPRLGDHVGDRRRNERDGPDGVVVPRNRDRDEVRIGVRVHDRHHGDSELVRLGHRDALLLCVHHEQRPGQATHVLDPREVLLQLGPLAVEQQLLLLGVVFELALGDALLQLLEPLDLLLDGLEVGQRAAQPALRHPERTAALRLGLDDVLELLLGADEQDALTLQHHAPHELRRGLELTQRLLEIDDVDAAALGEDEAAHLRVPPSGLVPEVDPRLEQVLQLGLRHALPLGVRCQGSGVRCRGSGPDT